MELPVIENHKLIEWPDLLLYSDTQADVTY